MQFLMQLVFCWLALDQTKFPSEDFGWPTKQYLSSHHRINTFLIFYYFSFTALFLLQSQLLYWWRKDTCFLVQKCRFAE